MRRLFAALTVGLVALAAPLALTAQPLPQPGFPQDRYSDFRPDAAVTYGRLENGVRYAIQRWQQPKDEVSIRLRVAAGSLVERDDQAGLMHFLEHMAFNGSTNVPENEFDRMLAREGLQFGPDTNAYTSFDETVYQLDMPHGAKLPLGLMLMRETASNLTLGTDAIDRERGIIEGEERARDNPGFRRFKAWFNHAFPGTLMIRRLPIGSMEVVRTAPRDRFVELYQGYYTPDRVFVTIVGDIDPAAAEAEVRKAFGDWRPAAPGLPDPALGALEPNAGKITLQVDAQLPATVNLSVTSPYVPQTDTSANRRADLLLSIANGVLNTRLERIAQRPDAPFLSASASAGEWLQTARIAEIEATPKTDAQWQPALNVIDLELRRMLQFGANPEEIAVVMANLKESYERAVSQAAARRSRGIAESILGAFGNDSVYTDAPSNLAWFNQVAPTITAAAVNDAIKARWGSALPALFIGSTAPLAGGEATVRGAYEAARAQPVTAAEVLVTKPWDYTRFGAPGRVVSTRQIADLGVTQMRFANNVRLIVKPSNFEPGRVRVAVRFGEGQLALTGANPAMQSLTLGSSFIAGGLGRFKPDELERTLAGKSVGLGFGVDDDAFVFSGTTTNGDLPLQMQVFAAFMTDPAWRTDGFERLKAFKDPLYRQLTSTPGSVWGTYGAPVLRSGNRRFQFPTPEQFEAQTLEAARAPLDAARQSAAVEVVIVGDTTVEAARRAVATTFGALPARAAEPARHPYAERVVFTPGRGTTVLRHDGRPDQSLAMIYWPMRDYGDGAEVRAIRVLENILQTRLTEVIREQEGATYSPSTTWDPSTTYPGFGMIGASMEVKPEDADRMLAKVEEIAADLAAGKIDADLFRRAREPLLADIVETRANNPWWLNWLQGSSFNPVRLGIIRNGQAQYERVTLDQVKVLARQYLRPDLARLVKVVPNAPGVAAAATAAAPTPPAPTPGAN